MSTLATTLDRLGEVLAAAVSEAFESESARVMSEPELLEVMAAAARIVRSGEALIVETTGQVAQRSDGGGVDSRMSTRFGCRSVAELVQRTTRASHRTAADYRSPREFRDPSELDLSRR